MPPAAFETLWQAPWAVSPPPHLTPVPRPLLLTTRYRPLASALRRSPWVSNQPRVCTHGSFICHYPPHPYILSVFRLTAFPLLGRGHLSVDTGLLTGVLSAWSPEAVLLSSPPPLYLALPSVSYTTPPGSFSRIVSLWPAPKLLNSSSYLTFLFWFSSPP